MNIFDTEHDHFRSAVINAMRDTAITMIIKNQVLKNDYYATEQGQGYIDSAIDVAFSTILICLDPQGNKYGSLTDTACRRCAKSEVYEAVHQYRCLMEKAGVLAERRKIREEFIAGINAEGVFLDLNFMNQEDDEEG